MKRFGLFSLLALGACSADTSIRSHAPDALSAAPTGFHRTSDVYEADVVAADGPCRVVRVRGYEGLAAYCVPTDTAKVSR